jgi:hypothetical protein
VTQPGRRATVLEVAGLLAAVVLLAQCGEGAGASGPSPATAARLATQSATRARVLARTVADLRERVDSLRRAAGRTRSRWARQRRRASGRLDRARAQADAADAAADAAAARVDEVARDLSILTRRFDYHLKRSGGR